MDTPITRISDLRALGVSTAEQRRLVAGLDRLAPGAYARTEGMDPVAVHIARACAVLGRVSGVVASHTTAAAIWGLPLRAHDLGTVQVSRVAGRRGGAKSGRAHHVHCREVAEQDIDTHAGALCTGPVLTVLDCARILDEDWAVAIADAALHTGLVSRRDLATRAELVINCTGAGRARLLPALTSALAESPGESLLRRRLSRMGVTPREQVEIGVDRVDFLVEGCLVVEFDGRGKYELQGDPAAAHWAEKRRNDRLVELGYEVLHVTWADLWDEVALARRVARSLRRAQARAQHDPLPIRQSAPIGTGADWPNGSRSA
jgi:very-short-patch-repair endonuclease